MKQKIVHICAESNFLKVKLQNSWIMTLLRLSVARDCEGSPFQATLLRHFQQLQELKQGLDLNFLVDGGNVVSIHQVVLTASRIDNIDF